MHEKEFMDHLKAQADDWMNTAWEDAMSDGTSGAETALHVFYFLGIYNQEERELWSRRLEQCFDNGDHNDGRAWCAYCGDLPRPCDECGQLFPPGQLTDVGYCDYGVCSSCKPKVEASKAKLEAGEQE